MNGVLGVENLTVRYGGMTAVDDLSFRVSPGTAVGLIGPNGAGKTSVIDALSGFARASGRVWLDGTRIDGLSPHARVRAGLSRTFQSLELFDDLTVRENVLIGGHRMTRHQFVTQPANTPRAFDDVDALLDFLDLLEIADRKTRDLAQGHRKVTSVARALASSPHVVLLDEPAAGLDSTESAWLGTKLKQVVAAGTAILLVDHDVNLVLTTCAEVHVLNFGRCIASDSPERIRANEEVVLTYLGASNRDEQPMQNGVCANGATAHG
jgi:ABC-type branched-subunit amino acid transport system ATPase component